MTKKSMTEKTQTRTTRTTTMTVSHTTKWAMAVVVVAVAASLSGCLGSTPTQTPTPTPSALPSTPAADPSPTADADPLTAVDGLVARPDRLELRAAGEVVGQLGYMSSPAEAVSALTTVFGEPPVEEPYAGGNHTPDRILHRWDLFVLDERLYDEDRRQAEGYDWLVWPRFAVYFDGPAADGVVLSASSGLQAGDAWSAAEADPGFDADLWTCMGTSIESATTAVPSTWTGADRVNVIVMPSDDGATVQWIGAPEMEADGCA